jgi:hypothetical protein
MEGLHIPATLWLTSLDFFFIYNKNKKQNKLGHTYGDTTKSQTIFHPVLGIIFISLDMIISKLNYQKILLQKILYNFPFNTRSVVYSY